MSDDDIEAWVSAYIAFQEADDSSSNHPQWWAAVRFMQAIGDPQRMEECWIAILGILSREPPQPVIGVLAAGPLEDLVHHAGPQFIDRIELEARRNPAFRHLLGGVWESPNQAIWQRVESARGASW